MITPCPNQFLRVTFGDATDMHPSFVYFDRPAVGAIVGSRGDWSFSADFHQSRDDITGHYTSIAKIKRAIKDRWEGIKYRGFVILINRKGGIYDKSRRYTYKAMLRGVCEIEGKTLCHEHHTAIEHAKEAIDDHITEGANK